MDYSVIQGVFFDCWDTLIQFRTKSEEWNIESLKKHCVNREHVDFKEVFAFTEDFFEKYYGSHLDYEIKIESLLQLLVTSFDIRLDCDLKECSHDILTYLDPRPVKGIEAYLSFLERKRIPYFCLSNTIYSKEDTQTLIEQVIPSARFSFVEVSCDYGVKKPNPLFFKVGVKKSGLDIAKCVYIGDKLLQDAYGSYRSGFLHSVFLDWKKKKDRYVEYMKFMNLDTTFPYVYATAYEDIYKEDER